jgi:excisionase family DNA binding protein
MEAGMTAPALRIASSRDETTSRIAVDIRRAEATATELAASLSALTSDLVRLAAQLEASPAPATNRQAVMLTPEEAGDALRVSRTVVFSLIKAGTLRSVKIGNSRRVPATALTEYVASLHG